MDRGTVDGGAEQLARDLAGNVIELIRLHTEYRIQNTECKMENKINDKEYRIQNGKWKTK